MTGFLTKCTTEKRGDESGQVITKIKTDTVRTVVYIPRNIEKTIYIDKPTLRFVYKDRIIPQFQSDSTPTLSVRNYQDTVEVIPNVHISYNAEVTGILNHVRFGYKDTRRDSMVTKIITSEVTTQLTKHPLGIYAGFVGQLDGSRFGPQVTFVNSKFLVGASYNLIHNNFTQGVAPVQVSLGFKLGAH